MGFGLFGSIPGTPQLFADEPANEHHNLHQIGYSRDGIPDGIRDRPYLSGFFASHSRKPGRMSFAIVSTSRL